jgi:hypothetical protein
MNVELHVCAFGKERCPLSIRVISSNNHYCTGFLGSNLHNSKNNDVTFNNNCQTTANEKQVRCIVLTGYENINIVTDRPFDETIPLTEIPNMCFSCPILRANFFPPFSSSTK